MSKMIGKNMIAKVITPSLIGRVGVGLLFLFTSLSASGQIQFGLKAGMDVSNMSFSSKLLEKSNRLGFFVGPSLKIGLPIVGLGIDGSAFYSRREGTIGEIYMGEEETAVPKDGKFTENQLLVPIHLRYGLSFAGGGIFAFAGPQFGFNINGKSEQKVIDDIATWRSYDSEFSLNIGAGVTLSHLELTVNYNFPFGKTGELRMKDVTDKVFAKGTYKTWKIGLAYFF